MRAITFLVALFFAAPVLAAGNVLFIDMVWIPNDGLVGGNYKADRIRTVYPDAAQCKLALEGETRLFWTDKPGHRMLGTKQCTDGTSPTEISIEEFTVTVVQSAPNQ